MNLKDFDYILPKKLIAQKPAFPRSSSKLLIAKNKKISLFNNLYNFLEKDDVLIINNTKVIPAILEGKIKNKKIIITLHSKLALSRWQAFAKPAKFVDVGNTVEFKNNISAKVLRKDEAHVDLIFNDNEKNVYELLDLYGELPIPPYIKCRDTKENNEKNYQSIFSKKYGAYASPTASLHFDNLLIQNIKKKNIDIIETTLHVGAGTFLPLKNNIIENNRLHKERGYISNKNAQKISDAKQNNKKIVAVGTTVLRLLEDCYIKYSKIKKYNENTEVFIYPGFKFRVVDKLITNFHLPKSSLLLLVAAFGGKKKIFDCYKTAIKNKLRFFSYGDGMLINRYD